ncbi:MAG: class I SAM-dependent methyltransferase [Burkholderiaceae bacterium]
MGEFDDARQTWDRRFAQAEGLLFGEEPNPWLAEHHRLLPAGGRVLCVADGESRNGVFLAAAGFEVTAFDISPVAVDRARALAAARGVELELLVADASQWSFEPDAFDAVVAIFIQFAGPDLRARLFDGFRRTLRPGGVLLIEGYGERQLRYRTGGPGIPENLYQSRRLHMEFDGWEILASRDADIMLEEGTAHQGLSHTVAGVYRKPVPGMPSVRG